MVGASAKQQLKAARAALDDGDADAALALCREILKADRANYHAYVLAGVAATAKREPARAAQAYARAIALKPALPLAYKGVVDALSDESLQEHRVAVARAHARLAELSPSHADASRAKAAITFHALAEEDAAFLEEALAAWRALGSAGSPLPNNIGHVVFPIVQLLALGLTEETRDTALKSGPLADELDILLGVAQELGPTAGPGPGVELLVERIVRAASTGDCAVAESVVALQRLGAHEAILEIAEADGGHVVDPRIIMAAAKRGVHQSPLLSSRVSRCRAVIAAQLLHDANRPESAAALVGASTAQTAKVLSSGAAVSVPNCTYAIARAVVHLHNGEMKLAVRTLQAGKEIVKSRGNLMRCNAVLDLILGAALAADRKHADAIKAYGRVAKYAETADMAWMAAAAHRGTVITAIAAHGRSSRHASTAMEEAASGSINLYGLVQSVWTDALAGDIDCDRMRSLATRATEKLAANEEQQLQASTWDIYTLGPRLLGSESEAAAFSWMHLGQMLLSGADKDLALLEEARSCEVKALRLCKSLPGPLAILGWIQEQIAELSPVASVTSAMRCYEKCLVRDAAHPLAARRLARLYAQTSGLSAAVEVARRASDRDPRARWAWNVIGWARLERGAVPASAAAFQSALRGVVKRSARVQEAVFGTRVGECAKDHDLMVDIDSWRGLALAYRRQGKIAPALSCLDEAMRLAQNPPLAFHVSSAEAPSLVASVSVVLNTERGSLLQLLGRPVDAIACLEEIAYKSTLPLPALMYLGEAYLSLSAEDWLSGCYHLASSRRETAAKCFQKATRVMLGSTAHVNPASMFKREGGAWLEVASTCPRDLSHVFGSEEVESSLQMAVAAFSKALHYEPWARQTHGQDLGVALARYADYVGDEEKARTAVETVLSSGANPAALSGVLMVLARVVGRRDIARAAATLLERVATSQVPRGGSKEKKAQQQQFGVEVQAAALAIHFAAEKNIERGAHWAVAAIRDEPTDWQAWLALGAVREADASKSGWALDLTRSCLLAYAEADRLGGGPAAVAGLVRCSTQRLEGLQREGSRPAFALAPEASVCAMLAARCGLDEPAICRELIHKGNLNAREQAVRNAAKLDGDTLAASRLLHLYPFVPEVARFAQKVIS